MKTPDNIQSIDEPYHTSVTASYCSAQLQDASFHCGLDGLHTECKWSADLLELRWEYVSYRETLEEPAKLERMFLLIIQTFICSI